MSKTPSNKTAEIAAEAAERSPGAVIEVFTTDAHRIGLKAMRVGSGCRAVIAQIALGHHCFEWLYVTALVSPATGESPRSLSTGVDKGLFEETLALFAREAGAGPDRIILLVHDNAGWLLLQSALKSRTPMQTMMDWHVQKPELFKKQPSLLAGCDI